MNYKRKYNKPMNICMSQAQELFNIATTVRQISSDNNCTLNRLFVYYIYCIEYDTDGNL